MITYHDVKRNVLYLEPDYRAPDGPGRPFVQFDALKIAVYDDTSDIMLLKVNNTRVGKWVPWNTFITFVRYLYTMDCRGTLMCETALIDMLQGVIVKYARDGIRLAVRRINDYGRVKEIWLWNEDENLPYVNVFDAYRVKTQTAEGGGWYYLCTTREGAIARGFIVDAGGDECVGEPCGGVHGDVERGVEPGGFVGQLFTLDRKLAKITTLDRRVLSSCLSAHMALGKSRRETNLVAFCTTWGMRVDEAACRKMYTKHLPAWVPQYAGPEMWARYVVDMLTAGLPILSRSVRNIRCMDLCIEDIPPRLAAALQDTGPGEDLLQDLPVEMRHGDGNEIRLTYLRQLEPFKRFARGLLEAIYYNSQIKVTWADLPNDSGTSYVSAQISSEPGRVFRVGCMLADRVWNQHMMHKFYMQLRIEEQR